MRAPLLQPEWPPHPPPRLPGNGRVEVWRARLTGLGPQLPSLLSALPADEQQRAAGFRANAARLRFVAGRAVIRQLLGARLGIAPASVPLAVDERGKPRLAADRPPDWQFNLSHSGNVVLAALAPGAGVGVDVETLRPLDNWRALAARSFSPSEIRQIKAAPDPAPAFFEMWTRREAVLKAAGVGLAGALGRDLVLDPGWTALLFLAAPAHPACVAVRRANARVTFHELAAASFSAG